MTRRHFLAASAAPLAAQPRRPNIIFLLGDDHRWDALGCMGNPIIRTPNLDELGRNGVIFRKNFVTTAICVSSRASFFTGLYSRCHKIWEFRNEFPSDTLSRTYPMLLRDAGYRTGFIGKWGIDGGTPPASQFDFWRGFQGQGRYFPDRNNPKLHLTTVMGDQAVEFLNNSGPDRPFCLSVSFKAPHVQDEDPRQFLADPQDDELYRNVDIPLPKTAAPEYIRTLPLSVQRSEARRRWAVRFGTPELFQQSVKNYYRLISGIDRVTGRIREQLRRMGAEDNTVIIYTGDNGFYLAEHGLAGKWFMHEESIRTPLIIHDPRQAQSRRGRRIEAMTLNIDCAPTMLDLAGLRPPPSMQGRSMLPLANGARTEWREEFFYEHHFSNNGWLPSTEGVRTTDWKYTLYTDEPQTTEELFDLKADPLEERNLAATGASTLARLRERRQAWLKQLDQWAPDKSWQDPA